MVKDVFATFEYAIDEQDLKALHNAAFSTGEGGGLEGLAKRLRGALFGESSPGFLVLRSGFLVKDGTDESERRARLTSMSDSLAEALASEVLPQSADIGEKTGFVEVHRSEAAGFSGWNVYRGYRNNKPQKLHCDSTNPCCHMDVVMMTCVASAAQGGATRVVAAADVIDGLSPRARETLSKPVPFSCKDEWIPEWGAHREGAAPMIAHDELGRPTLQFAVILRKNVEHALQDDAMSVDKAFATDVRSALDEIEMVANDEGVFSRLLLGPGDLILLDNRRFLHARDGFEDDTTHQRLLLRYWLRTREPDAIEALFNGR